MGDVISIARHDVPAVAIITERFWDQSVLVAHSLGLSDIPRVRVPYPIAGTGSDAIARAAAAAVPDVVQALAVA